MTSAADPGPLPRKKSLFLPLMLGLVLAIVGGGAGFFSLRSGMLSLGHAEDTANSLAPMPLPDIDYVTLDPLIVTLPRATGRQFLRFAASLEVPSSHLSEVQTLRPRIVDVMNVYLRAVEPADFEDQMILSRLRSQLLRRIQVVAGEGRVRDLLVIEFTLN